MITESQEKSTLEVFARCFALDAADKVTDADFDSRIDIIAKAIKAAILKWEEGNQ